MCRGYELESKDLKDIQSFKRMFMSDLDLGEIFGFSITLERTKFIGGIVTYHLLIQPNRNDAKLISTADHASAIFKDQREAKKMLARIVKLLVMGGIEEFNVYQTNRDYTGG